MQHGSTLGPESKYIKLISADNCEICIPRQHAMLSETLKRMLPDYTFASSVDPMSDNKIKLENIM